jgi:hypothetical protein
MTSFELGIKEFEGSKEAMLLFLTKKSKKSNFASLIPSNSFIPNSNVLKIKKYFNYATSTIKKSERW